MDPLLPSFRRELRARAHHLHPVVSIGQQGLTPAVLHEIDVALTAHELIKVRIFSDDRDQRGALLQRICAATDCAPVQQIGKLLLLWRRRPARDANDADASGRRPGKTARTTAGRPRLHASAPATDVITEPRARRKPGKAPLGVPRAAAPRRRRGYRP